jgi:hypothetical protein
MSLLLVASFLAITFGGVLLFWNVAFATVIDPSLKGKDYWLTLPDRLAAKAFLPGVVLALVILLLGVLLGFKGLGIALGLHAPTWNRASSALWASVALGAILLCGLVVLLA